jgi:hypothetical protein
MNSIVSPPSHFTSANLIERLLSVKHGDSCPSNCSLLSYPNRMPKAHPVDLHVMSRPQFNSSPKHSARSPLKDTTSPLSIITSLAIIMFSTNSHYHSSSLPSPSSSPQPLLHHSSITPPHSSSLLLTPPHSSSLLLTPPHSSSLSSPPSTTANTLSSSKNPKISHPSTSLFALAKFHPDSASTAL